MGNPSVLVCIADAEKVPENGKPKEEEDVPRKGELNPEERRMGK